MQRIKIQNFHQIKNCDIEIRNILFLIGAQASGKSTIAKLIHFFKTLQQTYIQTLLEESTVPLNADNVFQNFRQACLERFIYSIPQEVYSPYEISFFYSGDSEDYIAFFLHNNRAECRFGSLFHDKAVRETEEYLKKRAIDSNVIGMELLLKNAELAAKTLFNQEEVSVFFPAGRNVVAAFPEALRITFYNELSKMQMGKDSLDTEILKNFLIYSAALVDYYHRRGNSFIGEGRNFLQTTFERILQGKYAVIDGVERILFENGYVALNNASSGQQEVIRLLQDIRYLVENNKKGFRIYEEPEGHLYPEAQKLLLYALVYMINITDGSIIITSHSPYVLSAINNLMYLYKTWNKYPQKREEIAANFCFENTGEGAICLDPNKITAYSLSTTREEYCSSLIDNNVELIGNNFLDNETEQMNEDFDFLYNINYEAGI